jgi:hypothetical protein
MVDRTMRSTRVTRRQIGELFAENTHEARIARSGSPLLSCTLRNWAMTACWIRGGVPVFGAEMRFEKILMAHMRPAFLRILTRRVLGKSRVRLSGTVRHASDHGSSILCLAIAMKASRPTGSQSHFHTTATDPRTSHLQ